MSLKRRILSGGSWAFTGKVTTGLLVIFNSAILTRLLSPAEIGAFFLSVSIVMIGSAIARAGLEQTAVRLIAENIGLRQFGRVKAVIYKVILLTAGSTCFIACILWFGGAKWLTYNIFDSGILQTVGGLIALWVVLQSFQVLLSEIFRGFHDIRLATIFYGGMMYGGLTSASLMAIFLIGMWGWGMKTTLPLVLTFALISSGITVLFSAISLIGKLRTLPATGANGVKTVELISIGGPLFVSNLSHYTMTYADIWILGAFRTEAEVAIYGTASRLVKLIPMCLGIANEVMAPLIAELKVMKQNLKLQRMLRTTAAFAAMPTLIILFVFIFAGPFILKIIYGPFYAGGAVVLGLLSIGQLANVWVGSCGYTLTMTGQHNAMMVISFLTGLFTVVIGLAVVDRFGSVGIAFVISFTMVFQQMAMLICAKWRCGIWTHASPQLAISEVLNFLKHYKKNHEKD